jgi:hypothetical protein
MTRQKRNHGNSFSGKCDLARVETSPLPELALVLVRLDHIASFVVNANHSVCERLRCFGNQIDAAMIFAGSDFVSHRSGGMVL